MGLNKRLISTAAAGGLGEPTDNFDIVTYTGTGTNQQVTGIGFESDFVWIKSRTTTNPHVLHDTVRGIGNVLYSNLTNAEGDESLYFTGVGDGFLQFGVNAGNYNNTGTDYVAWCWKAGGTAVSNTNGVTAGSVTAVTSQVSANQDAGFSICEFTTPSSGKPSWGHGLSQAPELIIVKNAGSTGHWFVYAPSILGQKELRFTTAAATSYTPDFISADSSKIDLGSSSFNIAGSSRHINYNFHSVDGYQKIGSYTGTGYTQNDISLSFAPRFVMVKNTSSSASWNMFDLSRDVANGNGKYLQANSSAVESNIGQGMIFLSNGFRWKDQPDNQFNGSGQTYIYLAIA